MPLSWNEIRARAIAFSADWADETSEDAEAKTFWDSFFNIFGITRRRIAYFEKPVKKDDGKGGFIDLLWKGVLLVEHKSKGKNLDRAAKQAFDYFPGLKERDLPRYVIVSDFAQFRVYDLDFDEITEFPLSELHKNIQLFGFIAGYQTRQFGQEDPVNIDAAEKLGKLHDQLLDNGYRGHALEVFLVRLLFCLFAEDTGIFERRLFQDYLEQRTSEDGSDLGMHLSLLFQVLDREEEQRQKNLDEQLAQFPYVNGKLFSESLPVPAFNSKMRETLLDCCGLDWSRISPAIFGSLFQSIMDKEARRNLGAHYTSETNILKALKPLFLDDLQAEFNRIRNKPKQLADFQKKLAAIRILDPACGCGNFLAIAYRELRELELEVLIELYKKRQSGFLDVGFILFTDVDQFYGFEIEEFPSQIAQVSLWLVDHQMNLKVSEELGQYFIRLPLKKAPNIIHCNALENDWREIIDIDKINYIVGNPPFLGKHLQSKQQKEEVKNTFKNIKSAGNLDYVACWYRKATDIMQQYRHISTAFVSTNSITQGEQVSILWKDLLERGVHINFAHRTFQWSSEARGAATVQCIIIGFSLEDKDIKWLFDYDSPTSQPHVVKVKNINPYLVETTSNVLLENRREPICDAPKLLYGNKPADGGHLILKEEEKNELVRIEPDAEKWIKVFMGADDYLYNKPRYCLWLVDITPNELKKMPHVLERVNNVKEMRLASKKAPTRELANKPYLFAEIRQSESNYLLVPRHTSENRKYIPFGYMPSDIICGDSNFAIPEASKYQFGIITSHMHMAWTHAVCGRLESRYRYSASIVYNNFPWPEYSEQNKTEIEKMADIIIQIRNKYPDSSPAELYDPLIMPTDLLDAHKKLDAAVDKAYTKKKFNSDAERVAFLFEKYAELIGRQ